MADNDGPLSGVRVLDLTAAVLGPVATAHLGDLGADVIKIEPPEGEFMRALGPSRNAGMGAYFLTINRNKRSVVLDLKTEAGRGALLRLAASCDVVVHNMRMAAAERLGLTYAALSARNARIILAAGIGFDQRGRYRDRPAYDDIIQGESGIAAMIDHMWAAALDEADKGIGYPRMFTSHRRPYATKDGHICLLSNTDEQWRRMFDVLGEPQLARDPRFATFAARTANIDALLGLVSARMTTRTTAEWRAMLDHADIPNGGMNSFEDILADPHLADIGFFQRHEHPSEGATVMLGVAPQFSESPGGYRRGAPRLGEHSHEVLAEAGFSAEEIAALSGHG